MSEDVTVLKSHLYQTLAASRQFVKEVTLVPDRVELWGGIGGVKGLREGVLEGGQGRWMSYVHPDDLGRVNEAVGRSLSQGENFEVRYRLCGEASPVWVREEGVVQPCPPQKPKSVLSVVREISEIQDLESRLGHARKMEAFGQLAGGVAHDFNNMLAVILGYSQLVLDDLGPDDHRLPFVQEIESAARRAASLTNQLLAFTRQEVQGTLVLQMDEVLSEMGKMLGRMIGEQIQLELNPGVGQVGLVRADRNQIEQLLIHLSVCARDLLPAGGFFTLHTQLMESGGEAGGMRFLLAAECRALSPVSRERPSPGEVVPWSDSLAALDTCVSIVSESQGTLTPGGCPNLPGALAIFFPLAVPFSPSKEIQGNAPGGPGAAGRRVTGKTVLLVEDDKGLRSLGRVVITRMGYQVLEAENGAVGLKAFETAPPGEIILIITDIVMPAMAGSEMVEKILAQAPAVPVLFISGYPEQFQKIQQSKPATTYVFLRKPFPMGELTTQVRELLGRTA